MPGQLVPPWKIRREFTRQLTRQELWLLAAILLLALAAAGRLLPTAAAGSSPTSVLLAQTRARAPTPAIVHIQISAAPPWLLQILLVPWRYCGQLFRACGTRLLRVVMP